MTGAAMLEGNRAAASTQPLCRFKPNAAQRLVTMRGKKILLIIVGMTLLLAILALMLRRRSEQSVATSVANGPDGSFLVRVERPAFSGRPIWETPRAIFFGETDPRLRLSEISPGAKIGSVSPTHL